ncbi:hypothetical protein [Methylobacterium oryzisoli]|uniref:hypothetical protein n=1 Tax=Methylobacterium oryzisoli TaxID=3385502 RepID=UPI0038924149
MVRSALPTLHPAVPTGDLKHRAKRFNEGVKLFAALLNALSIGVFGAAFVVPVARRRYDVFAEGGWLLLLGGVCLHGIGQIVLRFFRAEE